MNVKKDGNNTIITEVSDFNLRHIFDCGQCFRWNTAEDGSYTGVAMGKALKIMQTGDCLTLFDTEPKDFYDIWYDYFDFGRDYAEIKNRLSDDPIMREAIKYGYGIRILNQELWETVVSFIISASNNIPRIKGIVERLCAMYGKPIEYMGDVYYSFPDIQTMSALTKEDIAPIRAGFRDKYIIDAAEKFSSGALSDTYLRSLPTESAKKALLSINGVGDKVANCILLFGLARCESFPVDVWIKRVMEYFYFDKEQSIDTIAKKADKLYGDLGGFAQQYLFFYAREEKIGL